MAARIRLKWVLPMSVAALGTAFRQHRCKQHCLVLLTFALWHCVAHANSRALSLTSGCRNLCILKAPFLCHDSVRIWMLLWRLAKGGQCESLQHHMEAPTAEESSYCLFGVVFVSHSSAFFAFVLLSIFAVVQPHVVAVMLHRCVSHAACGNTCTGKLM
ncbi:hypothetical protein TRVL_09734 [Trypanosoma vivax]|nr:hypothetical protein TRVL_09734 [Trypanosoma vivax]